MCIRDRSINTRDINQFTYVLNLSISKHINQFTYVLDLSISKQDINPFTYTDIILQHYIVVPRFSTLLYLPGSVYVRTHNVTTDTNKWRAKPTDIYITRFDSYKQANVYITSIIINNKYNGTFQNSNISDRKIFPRIISNKEKLISKTFILCTFVKPRSNDIAIYICIIQTLFCNTIKHFAYLHDRCTYILTPQTQINGEKNPQIYI